MMIKMFARKQEQDSPNDLYTALNRYLGLKFFAYMWHLWQNMAILLQWIHIKNIYLQYDRTMKKHSILIN